MKSFFRRVQGEGHNFLRKAQLALEESPLTNGVKISLDASDIPTIIKGHSSSWTKDAVFLEWTKLLYNILPS